MQVPRSVHQVLLAIHFPVHREDAHVPVFQLRPGPHKHRAAVLDIRGHAVAGDAHSEVCGLWRGAGGDHLKVAPIQRDGDAGSRGGGVQGDVPLPCPLRLLGFFGGFHSLQFHRADGLHRPPAVVVQSLVVLQQSPRSLVLQVGKRDHVPVRQKVRAHLEQVC